jgi:hypothetical protein
MPGIPENAKAIYSYLISKGASANAAAGILGNIEQESGGDPMAGSNPPGRGLIQKLGDPGGSLSSELTVMLDYINANGGMGPINAHAQTPEDAAAYFSNVYERPGIPDMSNRTGSAALVAEAAKSGNWPKAGDVSTSGNGGSGSSSTTTIGDSNPFSVALGAIPGFGWIGSVLPGISGVGSTIGDVATGIGAIGTDLSDLVRFTTYMFKPQLWLRVGAALMGVVILLAAVIVFAKATSNSSGGGGGAPTIVPIPV